METINLKIPFLVPVCTHKINYIEKLYNKHTTGDDLKTQMDIFICIATNTRLDKNLISIEKLDYIMSKEPTFYTCRAVRRLLLGQYSLPCIFSNSMLSRAVYGPKYEGPGLIVQNSNLIISSNIQSETYLETICSLEITDNVCHELQHQLRAIYCPPLAHTHVNYHTMFRLVSRYLSMKQVDECVSLFIESLPQYLVETCKNNYFKLCSHLLNLQLVVVPQASQKLILEYYKFNIQSFVSDWIPNKFLTPIKIKILKNINKFPNVLINLCKYSTFDDIKISSKVFLEYQTKVNHSGSFPPVRCTKRDPGNKPLKVIYFNNKTAMWFIYPINNPIYRIAMCMSVAESIILCKPSKVSLTRVKPPNISNVLTAMFKRVDFAPKDPPQINNAIDKQSHIKSSVNNQPPSEIIFENFAPIKTVSVSNFKINIFNTNMVINTKITCHKKNVTYSSILDIPRLTNNFVISKYSVKEPSFTISVFYSEDMCSGAAININISGGLLNFLFAMGNLKCFLPISNIWPVSISNWNSTLDLHGLENQEIVRSGRQDVFWTTNFPSAVSSKEGFNVSWFKAATATVSKIHGQHLVSQIHNETTPILTNNQAKINIVKNNIFTTLEFRNKSQIQTLHKRFIECLFECCSFLRLDVHTIRRATNLGLFNFSKKIISHSKNKHECAIIGYKICNLIPKVLVFNKKIRMDELGRNANFITFIQRFGMQRPIVKQRVIRHVIRSLGLCWRIKNPGPGKVLASLPRFYNKKKQKQKILGNKILF